MATSSPTHRKRAFRILVVSLVLMFPVGACRQQNYFDDPRDSATDAHDARGSDGPPSDAARPESQPPDVTRPEASPPDIGRPEISPPDATTDLGLGGKETYSPCLDAERVISVADVPDDTTKSIQVWDQDNFATYDMRGVTVRAEPNTHLVNFDGPANICVTGVSAIAKYPSGFVVNWDNVKYGDGNFGPYDEGGLHTSYPKSGTTVFDRVYVEGTEDGLMIARISGKDPTERWELRHSYLKNIIDDAVENDGYRSGKVVDVLSEGTHAFYSARNDFQMAHSVLIDKSVISFGCKPDDRSSSYTGAGACPKGTSTQRVFKLGDLEPAITVQDTIIHQPAISREGPDNTCLPSKGTYRNVTIVWTASVPYPCRDLAGVKVTIDRNVYTNARALWLQRHGCNSDGTGCAFLSR